MSDLLHEIEPLERNKLRNIMDNSGMHGGDRSGRVMLLIFMKVLTSSIEVKLQRDALKILGRSVQDFLGDHWASHLQGKQQHIEWWGFARTSWTVVACTVTEVVG
ncbi:hypothetical protein P8452_31303 [Trifolium repens]|nr:hypothetical protein P8452_31303 [Trifolium repens]